MKHTGAREAAYRYLKPLARHVQDNRGAMGKLAELVSLAVGAEVHRNTIASWLNSDPERRHEPTAGMFVTLIMLTPVMLGTHGGREAVILDKLSRAVHFIERLETHVGNV